MFNRIQKEANELKEVESILFYFVHFIDRLNFIFVQDHHQVREIVLVYELIAYFILKIYDFLDQFL